MENSGPAESSWRVCCTLAGGKAEGWDVGASGRRAPGRYKEDPQG